MHFLRITADAVAESGIGDVLDTLNAQLAETSPFDQRDYGPGIRGVAVVLVCQPASAAVTRRVRMAKSDQRLFFDVMLELDRAVALAPAARVRWVLDRLADELPATVDSFELPAFDNTRFRAEVVEWATTAFPA